VCKVLGVLKKISIVKDFQPKNKTARFLTKDSHQIQKSNKVDIILITPPKLAIECQKEKTGEYSL